MPAKEMGKKVVIMAEKGEGEERLCKVLETYLLGVTKHFCVNCGCELNSRVQYREIHISPV